MHLKEFTRSVRRWELSSIDCVHVTFRRLHARDMIQTCWIVTIKVDF